MATPTTCRMTTRQPPIGTRPNPTPSLLPFPRPTTAYRGRDRLRGRQHAPSDRIKLHVVVPPTVVQAAAHRHFVPVAAVLRDLQRPRVRDIDAEPHSVDSLNTEAVPRETLQR